MAMTQASGTASPAPESDRLRRTSLTSRLLGRPSAGALVITKGEQGCTIFADGARTDVPAVPPRHIVDPTGVGDAFRGGFLKGMARGVDLVVCARLGAVAAAYALEHLGGQSHNYSWPEFRERFVANFGAHAGLE